MGRTLSESVLALTTAGTLVVAGCSSHRDRPDPSPVGHADPASQLSTAQNCEGLTGRIREAALAGYNAERDSFDLLTAGRHAPIDAAPDVMLKAESGTTMANPAATPEYSTTNTQESGVDEADHVLTNGKVIFSAMRVPQSGASTVQLATADTLERLSSTPIEDLSQPQMLLHDDTLTVVGAATETLRDNPSPDPTFQGWPDHRRTTRVVVFDISDPRRPVMTQNAVYEGRSLTPRMVAGRVRLVLTAPAPIAVPMDVDQMMRNPQDVTWLQTQRDRSTLSQMTGTDWIPRMKPAANQPPELLTSCSQVQVGKVATGSTTVVTFDPETNEKAQATTVLADTDATYVSAEHVYLAGRFYDQKTPHTRIHALSVDADGKVSHTGYTTVAGSVKNQFSFSEHKGSLRVATTISDDASALRAERHTDNAVTVLSADDLSLRGRLNGLGKAGETIHGVRFAGDEAYVVTFRNTDPLYVIDLRDPSHPRKGAELQMPGYSAYLHPLGDGKVIGIGRGGDGTSLSDVKVSLFDLSDPVRPRELSTVRYPRASSRAESDHHAVLWWPPTKQLIIPVGANAQIMKLTADTLVAERAISHPIPKDLPATPPTSTVRPDLSATSGVSTAAPAPDSAMIALPPQLIERVLVVSDSLITVSRSGIASHSLATGEQRHWLAN